MTHPAQISRGYTANLTTTGGLRSVQACQCFEMTSFMRVRILPRRPRAPARSMQRTPFSALKHL